MIATLVFFSVTSAYSLAVLIHCLLVLITRKARGYFTGSISSSMAPITRLGMPARARMGTAARPSPEFTGPITTCTLSLKASCCAKLTALVGSPAVSRVSSSICRPLMPPALLISSTASCTPWFSAMAADDSGPVSDDSQPTLMGCAWAASGAARHNAACTASRPRFIERNDIDVSSDAPLRSVHRGGEARLSVSGFSLAAGFCWIESGEPYPCFV